MVDHADIWAATALGALATYASRGVGVLLAGRINVDGGLFRWVAAVAYALLAALIARMILQPVGAMAETALWWRLAGIGVAVAVFLATRRNILAGCVAGVATFSTSHHLNW